MTLYDSYVTYHRSCNNWEQNVTANYFVDLIKGWFEFRTVNFSNNKNFARNLEELHYFILTFFLGSYNGKRYSLPKYSFDHARRVFDDNPLDDVLFTFGVEKSGQLVLHNYPTTLMNLRIPKHQKGGRVIQHIVCCMFVCFLDRNSQNKPTKRISPPLNAELRLGLKRISVRMRISRSESQKTILLGAALLVIKTRHFHLFTFLLRSVSVRRVMRL